MMFAGVYHYDPADGRALFMYKKVRCLACGWEGLIPYSPSEVLRLSLSNLEACPKCGRLKAYAVGCRFVERRLGEV